MDWLPTFAEMADVDPRYHYALYLEEERQPAPVNIKVVGNHFEAGMDGVTNVKDE